MATAGMRRADLFGLRTWIGLALGLLVLVFAARGTDLRQVWSVLGTIQPVFLLLAVAVTRDAAGQGRALALAVLPTAVETGKWN
jgi:uncharacterized membrane protein YbhN (UPF0104 family)